MDRRSFLVRTGLTFAAGALAGLPPAGAGAAIAPPRSRTQLDTWEGVRDQFSLDRQYIHLGGLLLASHPAPVRDAIEAHRQGLDANPVVYVQDYGPGLEAAVLRAAAGYLGGQPADIALTDSTTMGLGLLYNGLDLRPGQEILTTSHDFYATHEAIEYKAARSGASVRTVRLYGQSATASTDEIVSNLVGAVGPWTRVVAVTWVHSSTGVKLPIGQMAAALAAINANRADADRALLCVDGVHGFGVEDVTMADLGCDFFVAGCHKWLFGPRGTGLVWGHPSAWPALLPTIPSFSGSGAPGRANTPGGYHSFEHRWALTQAFEFHQQIGKYWVAARIHELNHQFKEGLAGMPGVTLHTPLDDELSAGLICFEVAGLSPSTVIRRLRQQGIIATTTPYATSYARVAPGLLNTPEEVEVALGVIRALT
ncbi:MAG TPA: aminotransferase class V-fold PLP-dependent enzyme [Dehalococcoidia bacterium]|nr:aminotransferase class V-fold PLP-dependent enzyme [Dehalococcoidia bacterium]